MKLLKILCQLLFFTLLASCTGNQTEQKNEGMDENETINRELSVVDSLLQDEQFAESMAQELDAAYYKGTGQPVQPFLAAGEDSLMTDKSIKEEKIAINIAGFYALECGLDYLTARGQATPKEILEQIISKKAGDSSVLILNRFANATWKAGQPFRGMERIKRPNFMGALSLSDEEIQKDYRQITGAAIKLNAALKPGTREEQMNQIKTLLQDKDFAYKMAENIDSVYYAGENKAAPPFLKGTEKNAVKQKSFKAEKIAANLAGFYAVECAMNYLVTLRNQPPSVILKSITSETISAEDKLLFARFANATWKAGQPFRSLDRITRETFKPFYFLSKEDIDKDWVQVKTAAAKLLASLQ